MNKKGINASLLEKMLILLVVAIFGIIIGVYVMLTNFAKSQATNADHSMIDANSSAKDIQDLQKSYKWILAHPETVNKTNKIVAESSKYQYQDQIIKDIELYANQSGLSVSKYSFSEAAASATTPTTGTAAPAAAAGSAPAAAGATATPTGLSSTTVELGFGNSVSYAKTILFIKRIEQNVTRMQITSLSIAPDEDDKGAVALTMTISVFLNKGTQ
ncbi:MAG: hypothetical protein Q7T74_07265 [Candidatus Saccharibacteria bacterium]|nr:hypothetical protein [Candidatus Saccharibacteria bacterium]